VYLSLENEDSLGEGVKANLYLPAGTFQIMLSERVCM